MVIVQPVEERVQVSAVCGGEKGSQAVRCRDTQCGYGRGDGVCTCVG
jgi:hypothetical protein